MQKTLSFFALAVTMSALSACSGSSTTPPTESGNGGSSFAPLARMVKVQVALATPAPPLDPRTPVSLLGTVHAQNLAGQPYIAGIRPQNAVRAMLHASMSQNGHTVVPDSSVRYYDTGGQEGFAVYPKFDDTEAVLTAYGSSQLTLPQPPGGSQYPNEIANAMHAGQQPMDGTTNCLEVATVYQTYYGQGPKALLEVGDWCQSPGNENFNVSYSLDDFNFGNAYIRNLGNGIPSVQVELYQPLGGDGSWHAAIYNFGASRWDDLYHTYGSAGYDSSLQYAWDLAETHYYPGPCPIIPTFASFNFQGSVETGNDSQNYWRNIQSSEATAPSNPSGADCFSNDGSGVGGVYNYFVTNADSAWQVNDPGPTPSPRPRPTPCGNAVIVPNRCPLARPNGSTNPNLVCC